MRFIVALIWVILTFPAWAGEFIVREGSNKARFGMTADQIRAAYPEATADVLSALPMM